MKVKIRLFVIASQTASQKTECFRSDDTTVIWATQYLISLWTSFVHWLVSFSMWNVLVHFPWGKGLFISATSLLFVAKVTSMLAICLSSFTNKVLWECVWLEIGRMPLKVGQHWTNPRDSGIVVWKFSSTYHFIGLKRKREGEICVNVVTTSITASDHQLPRGCLSVWTDSSRSSWQRRSVTSERK